VNEKDFEGTLILEKLVAIGRLDDFWEAIDSDNIARARQLMKQAQVDAESISVALSKMENSED
jgi:hypothetical protein